MMAMMIAIVTMVVMMKTPSKTGIGGIENIAPAAGACASSMRIGGKARDRISINTIRY